MDPPVHLDVPKKSNKQKGKTTGRANLQEQILQSITEEDWDEEENEENLCLFFDSIVDNNINVKEIQAIWRNCFPRPWDAPFQRKFREIEIQSTPCQQFHSQYFDEPLVWDNKTFKFETDSDESDPEDIMFHSK
jgi:hypothetical protein